MKIKKVWFLGLFILSATIISVGIRCSNKSSTSSGGGSGQPITMSGTLQQGNLAIVLSSYGNGVVQTENTPLLNSNLSPLSGAPLTGYQLYCVTFTSPAVAGNGTADASGNVTITFNAKNTPFGCFILDTSSNGIATLIFTNTTSGQNSQTVSFNGNANLGVVTVDLTDGVAQAILPSTGSLVTTTPPGTPCPIGTWAGTGFSSGCSAGGVTTIIGQNIYPITTTVWIAQKPSGQYAVNFTLGPVCITPFYSSCMCGSESFNDLPATYSGGTLQFSVGGADASCPSKILNMTATFDSSCKVMTVNISQVGCQSCGCSSSAGPFTFTKQ